MHSAPGLEAIEIMFRWVIYHFLSVHFPFLAFPVLPIHLPLVTQPPSAISHRLKGDLGIEAHAYQGSFINKEEHSCGMSHGTFFSDALEQQCC